MRVEATGGEFDIELKDRLGNIASHKRAIDKHIHQMIDTWEYVHWDEIDGLIRIAKRKAIGVG